MTLEKGNLNRREEREMGKRKTWRERKDERKEKLPLKFRGGKEGQNAKMKICTKETGNRKKEKDKSKKRQATERKGGKWRRKWKEGE